MNFEQSLGKLDEIIKQLENNEISLEDSVKAYTEGTALLVSCRKQLEEARLVIKNENDAD